MRLSAILLHKYMQSLDHLNSYVASHISLCSYMKLKDKMAKIVAVLYAR
jgi:hypothetical protein